MSGNWVALGVFTQPHGVSGRIKVKSLADGPDDFAEHTHLTDESGNPVKLRITGHAQGMAVVEIEGVTRREQAELLRGRKIGVPRAAVPTLDAPNCYYIHDLIGLPVVDGSGADFGHISSVNNYGAGDIITITTTGGEEALFAFTHATFPIVDIAARRVVIHPPEILEAKPDNK